MNQEHCSPQGPDPAAPGLSDWLMDLLGRSVADLGATRRPGTSSSGAVWGSIPHLPTSPPLPRNWPREPVPIPGTSPNGWRVRPPDGTSSSTPMPVGLL